MDTWDGYLPFIDCGDDFTKDTKTVTGLQNMTVIAIMNKVDSKLVVLTANSGVQELELK